MDRLTHGISIDELPRIEREQLDHFLALEKEASDPASWREFSAEVLTALAAAWGWAPRLRAEDQASLDGARTRILEEIRGEADPTNDWDGFVERLFDRRHDLRRGC